jgi:hypothetical protein
MVLSCHACQKESVHNIFTIRLDNEVISDRAFGCSRTDVENVLQIVYNFLSLCQWNLSIKDI